MSIPNEGHRHIAHRIQRRNNILRRQAENRERHRELKLERDSFSDKRTEDISRLEEQLSLELEN